MHNHDNVYHHKHYELKLQTACVNKPNFREISSESFEPIADNAYKRTKE